MSSFHRKASTPPSTLREYNVGLPEDAQFDDPPEPTPVPLQGFNQANAGYELSAAEREELQKFRRDNNGKTPRLGDHARKRIEILANIGRLTKDVEVDGITFSLRTLKNQETREATISIFECKNDADAAFELRRQTLARALYQVDGQDMTSALGGDDFNLKLQLLDDMEEIIFNKLYNAFSDLRQEVRIKYGLETEQQAKEVVEDIKK